MSKHTGTTMWSRNNKLSYTPLLGWVGTLEIDGTQVDVFFDSFVVAEHADYYELEGLEWSQGCNCPECVYDYDTVADAVWEELGYE